MSLHAAAPELREIRAAGEIQTAFAPKAKLRVLNVWATWCAPCVAEMSDLRAVDAEFGPEVSFAGVTLDDMLPGDRAESKKKVRSFLEQRHISFPNLYYIGNADKLAEALRFSGQIPITIIYGNDDRELWRHEGQITKKLVADELRKLLRRTR
jgi:thiol-disulfide isomerase/thioredoxin